MADQLFKGFYDSLAAGDLDGSPDIRLMLTMAGFTCDADAVNLSDATDLDEFDGVGYVRIDAANVSAAYDTDDDEWQLVCDSDSFGDTVAPGSGDIDGMVVYLYVDGDPDNDVILGRTDTGFGVNAANGALNLTVPAAGLMFVRQAT